VSPFLLHNWATRRTHGSRCPNGVTAAFQSREIGGAGSTPTWGSYKTNDEVLAKLLTWGHVLGKHQVVRAGWGNLTGSVFVLLVFPFRMYAPDHTKPTQELVLCKSIGIKWRHSNVSPLLFIEQLVVDTLTSHEIGMDFCSMKPLITKSGDTAMCRHSLLHNWDTRRTHGCRCPDGVTAACRTRHSYGAGSTPTRGSCKTNDEVLAKLLTKN
jgi:hypothetical protein